MKKTSLPFTAVVSLSLFTSNLALPRAEACTSFSLNPGRALGTVLDRKGVEAAAIQRAITAESFDWAVGAGFGFVLPRSRKVEATVADPGRQKPATWISRYGSLAFSPVGPGFTVNGINEAGLTVMVMQADPSSNAPSSPTLPIINEMQWPQYILDTSETLADALKQAELVEVLPLFTPLHYLVCDKRSDCAVFEQIDGKMVAYHAATLPVPTLSNSTYSESIGAWKSYEAKLAAGGRVKLPSDSSLERFVVASLLAKEFRGMGDPTQYAFYVLSGVHQRDYTKWNMVYDRQQTLDGALTVTAYFRTSEAPSIKKINVGALDFSCVDRAAPKVIEMDSHDSGDVLSRFREYTAADQQWLGRQNVDFVGVEEGLMNRVAAEAAQGYSCAQGAAIQ